MLERSWGVVLVVACIAGCSATVVTVDDDRTRDATAGDAPVADEGPPEADAVAPVTTGDVPADEGHGDLTDGRDHDDDREDDGDRDDDRDEDDDHDHDDDDRDDDDRDDDRDDRDDRDGSPTTCGGPVPETFTCDDVQAELDCVQACTDDAECGQPIPGGCGCTRTLIARLDASLDRYEGMVAASPGCGYGTTCDCPEADGFACVDGRCTWNYVDQP